MLGLAITIVIIGLIYYAITMLPVPAPFKTIALVVCILWAIMLLLPMVGTIDLHR